MIAGPRGLDESEILSIAVQLIGGGIHTNDPAENPDAHLPSFTFAGSASLPVTFRPVS